MISPTSASRAMAWAHGARFLTTASQLDQLPASELPEIAFVGRSNAGKSTAINVLAQQRRLAFASRTPGRTQHINLFEVGPRDAPDVLWADLPGYGYAAVERGAKLRWQQVMADYLALRRNLTGVVMMVDSRLGFTPLDRQLLEFLAPRVGSGQVRLLVVLTKADKLNRREADAALRKATEALGEFATESSDMGIALFSALKRTGVEDVASTLLEWARPSARELPGGLVLRDVALPHGITLKCRENAASSSENLPTALFLHGFPEAAFVWDPLLQALQGQARAVAPNLRGYAGSSSPSGLEAYRARPLVADLEALIDSLGGSVDLLVAHDWGGALAWNLAALRPDQVKRLLIINAPHSATFLRELRSNPKQQAASAYMNFLCRSDAEQLLAEDEYARLWAFFTNRGAADPQQPGVAWLTPALKRQYREVWNQGLSGPLAYYAASPLRPATQPEDALHALQLPPDTTRVRVPTTVLWGEKDTALLPELLEGLNEFVPDLDVIRLPEATHWVVHEQPDRVLELVRRLLPN